MKSWPDKGLELVFDVTKVFSNEVDTGSREENASNANQEARFE
jgi:hypothetical protein